MTTQETKVPTEAMIEAGLHQFQKIYFDEEEPADFRSMVREIYLAMQSASPNTSEDVVERVAEILREYTGCSFDPQRLAEYIARQIASPTPRDTLVAQVQRAIDHIDARSELYTSEEDTLLGIRTVLVAALNTTQQAEGRES